MDYGLSPAGSRSPLTSSNSSCPDPNPTPTPTPTTADDDPHVSRPPRACEYCRQHKVRCDIDLRDPSGSCGRCQKAGRDCVSSSYSRKRRKTTDSRVLDLERKVERLTSRLDGLERRSGFEGGGSGEGHEQPTGEHSSGYQIPGGSDTRTPPAVVVQPPNSSDTTQIQEDVIDRQILSIELAGRMFQHYITKLVPVFPAVVFSPDTASSDIRRQKPILFLAILSVASGEFDTKLQGKLYKELLKCFADQIIFRGTKSLELIQALTVSVLWHQPPETSGGNNLNQFIHMAAVMASDIAITKSSSSKKLPGPATDMSTKAEPLSDHFPMGAGWRLMIWGCNPDASLPECRRAFLSCYFMCSKFVPSPLLVTDIPKADVTKKYFSALSSTKPLPIHTLRIRLHHLFRNLPRTRCLPLRQVFRRMDQALPHDRRIRPHPWRFWCHWHLRTPRPSRPRKLPRASSKVAASSRKRHNPSTRPIRPRHHKTHVRPNPPL